MNRAALERHQVWIYLVAVALGMALGNGLLDPGAAHDTTSSPAFAPAPRTDLSTVLAWCIWPTLAALMYTTFTQVPLAALPAAARHPRFIAAALLGNFVVLPVVVWGMLTVLPGDPAMHLGLALVLLVPCTDWFIAFTHQGGGDARRAITLAPVLLLVQMVLLPVFLWLMLGPQRVATLPLGHIAGVSVAIIALPLLLAVLTQRYAARRGSGARLLHLLGGFPVPLLAVVLMLIAATQTPAVWARLQEMHSVVAACIAFLLLAVLLAWSLARLFRLPTPLARTLVFSMSTRNSFVVLPVALALPAGHEIAAIVIVLQSLVELLGMLALLWWVPHWLMPAREGPHAEER